MQMLCKMVASFMLGTSINLSWPHHVPDTIDLIGRGTGEALPRLEELFRFLDCGEGEGDERCYTSFICRGKW